MKTMFFFNNILNNIISNIDILNRFIHFVYIVNTFINTGRVMFLLAYLCLLRDINRMAYSFEVSLHIAIDLLFD